MGGFVANHSQPGQAKPGGRPVALFWLTGQVVEREIIPVKTA
jgi:hypothetical protein